MEKTLRPGDRHYRAFVGPPEQYDVMGLTQLSLLHALGLREGSRVLDVGCGSLRAGRFLIPFLGRGRYCGIEPQRWLLRQGLWRNVGLEMWLRRRPRFDHHSDFRLDAFGGRFDFIVAQSILSHTEADLAEEILCRLPAVLAPRGFFAGTFLLPQQAEAGQVDVPGRRWRYPGCVGFSQPKLAQLFRATGLHWWKLNWQHPRQTWYVASPDPLALGPADLEQWTGHSLGFQA